MADVDVLARRAVRAVTDLAARGAGVAIRVALFVGLVAVIAYVLGLAALDGSTRNVWIVIGAALVIVTAGAPLLAAWRLRRIRTHADQLVTDVRTMLTRNADAERVVIETVEVQDRPTGSTPAFMGDTTRFTTLRQVALTTGNLRALPGALRAVATFPALLALAILLMLVWLVLGLVFLIALAF